MQTLGRFAIIGGTVLVALVNVIMFAGVGALSEAEKIEIYGRIYLYALIIPLISVSGVFLAMYLKKRRLEQLKKSGMAAEELKKLMTEFGTSTQPNWWILGGSLVFVVFTLGVGILKSSVCSGNRIFGFDANHLVLDEKTDCRTTRRITLYDCGNRYRYFCFSSNAWSRTWFRLVRNRCSWF